MGSMVAPGISPRHSLTGPERLATAGDPQGGAGDVRRLVAHQPADGVGDLRRLADPAERDERADPVDPAGLAGVGVDGRPDDAGGHADDPDALAGDLDRQPGGQGVEAGLRGGVLDVLVRARRGSRHPTRR